MMKRVSALLPLFLVFCGCVRSPHPPNRTMWFFGTPGASNTFLSGITFQEYKNPKSEQEVLARINDQTDDFKKTRWIVGPTLEVHLSKGMMSKPVGRRYGDTIAFRLRSLIQNDTATFHQIYATLLAKHWYFIDECWDSTGKKRELIQIDREVFSGGSITETFAVTIDVEDLEPATSTKKFRFEGKRGKTIQSIPEFYKKAYVRYLKDKDCLTK